MPVCHTLFQRYNGIVGDRYVFRTNICAALGNVAETDPVPVFQVVDAVFHVEWVHFQRSRINHMARAGK